MAFVSFAQNFEDVLLWRALGDVPGGFYIDVGAWLPDRDSVTRAFYDRGWSGINLEPEAGAARRLREARPRDVTLEVVAGAAAGSAEFYAVDGTGLSTLDAAGAARLAAEGYAVERRVVAVATLAEVCAEHVRGEVHFLKVDAEGGECEVLAGADFGRFRPWIVVMEATAPLSQAPRHEGWEGLLTAAGYRFVWFDGLNRFYVAAEHGELARHFQAPPNVFDDFVRAGEAIGPGELARVERRARAAEERTEQAILRVAREAALRGDLEVLYAERGREVGRWQERVAAAERAQHEAADRVALLERELVVAERWLEATRSSTSWRLTAPLRRALGQREAAPARGERDGVVKVAGVRRVRAPAPRRAVHQFHSGSAVGDAITNAMILVRGVLRGLGYRSEIFVEHRGAGLEGEVRTLDELPAHDDYVLIVRHSMGYDAIERVMDLAAPKVLVYHNITPPEFLGESRVLQRYARLGREQLALWRPQAMAALADSEFNALELRALGFDPVRACPLLFDVRGMRAERAAGGGEPFTVLFVGRIIEHKGQLELLRAFAVFAAAFERPSRLVLVGRDGEERYAGELRAEVRRQGLERQVVITGGVSDAERDAWFGRADLYVSLSRHEGFGVPLVEAMAKGVPVLAWPAGAVAETLGGGGALLETRAPSAVAEEMLALALDQVRLMDLAERGQAAAERFALGRHVPALVEALVRAGAAPPGDPDARERLRAGLRFAVAGHFNGSYSLAAVNRSLALAIEREMPGRVRVRPVEGEPSTDLTRVPPGQLGAITRLAGRPAPGSGPEVVISQHFPVHVPAPAGDCPVALFFWEEGLVPAATVEVLNTAFRGVLAPARSVAKALVESGVGVPVRVLGQAPDLGRFRAVAGERGRREVFTFLHVSSCFPRKGVDLLLAAWARAFGAGDRVRLVIKGFPNPHNDVAEQIAAMPGGAEMRFVNEEMGEEALLALYREADAMVLPTRGEGYNLPAAEAMAAGVSLIVTGFGGHLDFCGEDEARLLAWDYAASGSHLASPGSVWAEPRVDDLVAALREAVAEPEVAAARAGRAAARIGREVSGAAMVGRLREAALDWMLAPPTAPLRVAWVTSWDVRCGIAEYSRAMLERVTDGELVILADTRSAAAEGGRRVRPVWRLGRRDVAALARAVEVEDPGAVVIQHQPGLMPWRGLARLLRDQAMAGRVVVPMLHNTQHLLEIGPAERRAAVAALGGCSRVLVHTVADLNRLKGLGLVANVAILPHGRPAPGPAAAVRRLERTDPVVIGSHGFFLPDKGLPELIEAAALLRREWPRASLRLVNADYGREESGEEIARCRALAEALGVEVEFCTEFMAQEAATGLLRGCDVVALPYQRSKEAASGAMRSAMAAGVAMAVTPLGVFEEAGDAVAWLPGVEPAAIAAGLGELIGDQKRRAVLAAAGREWLLAFGWEAAGRRLGGMLRGLTREVRGE